MHNWLACSADLDQITVNHAVWIPQLPMETVEATMDSICMALAVNCSDNLDASGEKLRSIRDVLSGYPDRFGCHLGRSISYELLSMAGFWLALLLLQIGQMIASRFCNKNPEDSTPKGPLSACSICLARIRIVCEKLSTPWSWPGKVMGIIWSACSVASFAFYLHQTYSHHRFIRFCQNSVDRVYAHIDLGFNIYFFVYFIIRYIASANKASFLIAPHSLMDICTIGPAICTVISLDKHSLFNFLRAIRLSAIKDVLISFNVISIATSKSLFSLIIDMFCFWSTLAGLIHLLENLDNFWWLLGPKVFNPCRALNFFNSFYMLIITASTVGYGDIYPRTSLGQLTVMICIVVAGTYFLTTVPALIGIYIESKLNRKCKFYTGMGQRHIVLTGSLEYNTVKAFVNDFYLDDRLSPKEWTTQVKCCVLHRCTLESDTSWLLYGLSGRVRPIRGSSVNPRDFMDVKAYSANAVIILAQLLPSDKEGDDCDNYMRAMTVKLNFPDVRTIVQIHSFYNKFSYYYLTGWRSKSLCNSLWDLDSVICNDQIANGLLGLNCVAPGFASLIINLLASYTADKTDVFEQYKWRTFYSFGMQANFYCARFTRSFRGLTFKAACAVVYDRWGIILLGVSVDQGNSHTCSNIINPSCDPNFQINPSIMKAFVICKNLRDLHRFETYCNYCKNKTDGVCTCDGPTSDGPIPTAEAVQRSVAEKLLREKQMRKNALFTNKNNSDGVQPDGSDIPLTNPNNLVSQSRGSSKYFGGEKTAEQDADCKFEDIVLMPECPEDIALEAEFRRAVEPGRSDENATDQPRDDGAAELLEPVDTWRFERAFRPVADVSGTLHWAPKRPCRLIDIEKVSDVPWTGHVLVCVLGKVESPVGLSALLLPLRNRLIELSRLRDIVILGDADGLREHEWRHVCNFRQIYLVRGSGLFTNHLVCCRVHAASAVAVMRVGRPPARSADADASGASGGGIADTDVLVCAENVRAVVIGRMGERHYREKFHLTVRLSNPDVASFFSDLKEREKEDSTRHGVTATQAFAEGLVFSDTQLASLVSATFHCPEVAQFIQALIQGSNQVAVENFLGSHVGIPSELDKEKAALLSVSYPFLITQLSIRDPPLSTMFDSFNSSTIYWEELYIRCLEKFDILCLGLYQLRKKSRLDAKEKKKLSGRFVYTFPSRRTIVDASDKVFCIIPSGCNVGDGHKRAKSAYLTKRIDLKDVIRTADNDSLNKKYVLNDPDGLGDITADNNRLPQLRDLDQESQNFNFMFPTDTDIESSCEL